MNIHHLSNSFNIKDSPNRQLFLPDELESIRLSQLRQKRHELEDKLKLVSNRISFRKKKEEDEIKRYIRSEERSRFMSETKNYKKLNDMLKDELDQKNQFETRKKAKEIEDYRRTHSRRLQLISQSVHDRKLLQSEKLRRAKRLDQEIINTVKHNTELQLRQKYEEMKKMKERQQAKKKYFWLVEKRLSFQQNMIEDAQIYEKQIQNFHKKIQLLKQEEEDLRSREEQATEVLRCAEQNYELLKKA